MSEWISVKERLPQKHTNVLCNVINSNNCNIQIILTREYKTHDGIECWLANFIFKPADKESDDMMPEIPDSWVTHWMPLPEPPKD